MDSCEEDPDENCDRPSDADLAVLCAEWTTNPDCANKTVLDYRHYCLNSTLPETGDDAQYHQAISASELDAEISLIGDSCPELQTWIEHCELNETVVDCLNAPLEQMILLCEEWSSEDWHNDCYHAVELIPDSQTYYMYHEYCNMNWMTSGAVPVHSFSATSISVASSLLSFGILFSQVQS
jgi:hypothetical protein